ncbi:glyoxylate/hydroxypyruvate reductase A [Alphaproteobacteria bacterium KMM 3653]|uniref:Glyoxylate/hydroxypyruvate reductase A n=1 Tax=Harenicola maris TaxID=2841044 RepID=A0AAP2G931_9RHOB|nr:glyoxylate/hydroxypyruvate reductase A [Harenicola maris]
MIRVLFAAAEKRWAEYEAPLRHALDNTGLDYELGLDFAPETVDYIVFAPNGPIEDFAPYTACKAILGLWAGVEVALRNETLTQPFARMVDDSLTQGMTEWVTGHVLRHHLGMDAHIVNPDHQWVTKAPPLAADRIVTILGIGELGAAAGAALAGLNFNVRGWSRSAKDLPGIACYHGEEGLTEALRGADFCVLLLPQTPATLNVLNAERLALMAKGSFVINPGRGPLIDDAALLAALESGQIAHATLDVFRTEPLPQDDPYWAHPRVTVTPHIASETRAGTASLSIAQNIARHEAGQPLANLVDRSAGY